MFHGRMEALDTPKHADERLDADGLARLVEFHIEQGSAAIVAVGTTGESPTLDTDEHCQVIRQVVELARGRVPGVAGPRYTYTRGGQAHTRIGKGKGADACLL